GLERVFQLAKCFRNQGEIGPWHHPEFTMLEWYEVDLGFDAAMAQTETLVQTVAAALPSAKKLPGAFKRISVKEAFLQFAKIELNDNDPGLAGAARNQGVLSVRADDDFETAFFKVLLEKVEPALARMDAV